MHTSRDQLALILHTLEPYWPLAHGLGVFVQSQYADEATVYKLSGFVQEAIAGIRLSSLSEKKTHATHVQQQAQVQKQQDLDKAEDLLAGLSPLGQETLEQNHIDSNADKVVDPNELHNLVPDLTNKERKKLAQDLSASPEMQATMLESCNKIYADISAKITRGEVLTKEDIELFQLSVYMLGKNKDVVIDGVITPGKLTEQLVKEINPEYFRTRLLVDWFGPECKVDIGGLRSAQPENVRNIVFEKVQGYRNTLVALHTEPEDMGKTLYNVFVQGINSRGKFDDKERFDDLDARIRKAQLQLKKQQEQKAKQKDFQEKQKLIVSIEKSLPTLDEQLKQLSADLESKQKDYEAVYKDFTTALQENNTFREKAKAVSPYLLAVATGPLGPLILTLRSKSSPSPSEMQQLILYEKLSKTYNEIVQLQNTIKKVRASREQKVKQQQCLYYEMLRDAGKRPLAEQALINLVNQYGDPIRKQYAADIQLYMQDASEINQALFAANKTKLNAIVQQKNRAIDIVQQLTTDAKPQWGMMDVAGLQYLSQEDIGGIIGNEGLQQANMMGEMVAVRDNTANVRVIQTQEVVTEQGNRMGTKKGYETVGGTTSTYGNILYAQYQVATNQFKTLTLPGMGSINVKIDPNLYNQIISFSEKGKQLTFDPVYNATLQCFEITSSNVFITQADKQGTVAYQARPGIGETVNYITKKEYQSLLQVKRGLTNLVTEQGPIMEVLSYQEQLQQVAAPIQQLAQLYSQTPGDAPLSNTIIRDLTKPGGLKDQLAGLKILLAKNASYQTIIAELRQNRSGVYDQYEKQLYAVEQMLQGLPVFAEQIDELLNYSIWEHADARTLKEFAVTVAAIVGGVLLAVATGGMATGVSAMVVSAAAGSLGGMASSRLAQEAFASWTNTGGLNNDLHGDIGKCMLGKAKWEDVLPNVAMEFAQGTATTLMFMGAGRIIGTQLEKFVTANAGVTSREVKLAYRTRKLISKLNDNEIQLLERKGFSKFIVKIEDELKEEFAQEGAQQGAEKIDPSLGTLVNIITSIGGKTQYRAGKVDVFFEGYDSETNATTVSYKGNAIELKSMLQDNFDASGYTFDGIDPNGNLVYSQFVGDKVHSIIFTSTQESTTIKEIDLPTHGQIYGIAFDGGHTTTDEVNTYHYTYENLAVGNNNLTTYLARNGMIVVDGVAEDGSFTALAKNGEKIVFNHKPFEQAESSAAMTTVEINTDASGVVTNNGNTPNEATGGQEQVAAEQQQMDQSLTELEQQLDKPVQDEKVIDSVFERITQSLRNQLQRAKGFAESVQQSPLLTLHTSIIRLFDILSKRSPEFWARSLSSSHLRELSTMCSGFIMEYGLILGPLVGIVAIVTSLSAKLQVITQLKLQQHMQSKLEQGDKVLLPTDKYGKPVYQNADGMALDNEQAITVYKSNLVFAQTFLESVVSGARYLIKTSFHLNSTTLLPSDVDVALNHETGKKLVEYFVNGGTVPGADGLVFEDTSKTPPQKIPLAHHRKLLAACEAGTLRIAYNTHIDGVVIEHEFFVENNNEVLNVFDAQGKPLDTVMVDVDGVLVPHLGEKTAIKYLSELVDRGFEQLMDGSDTKGKFFKRLRDLGDTKNTLGYLNAVNAFINNIRSWVENKIGFKRGDEYQKQLSELKNSSRFKTLFEYIPANHPALTAPVELDRSLDKDIHKLNEQCMSALRDGNVQQLGSTLLRIEQLLKAPSASIDQLVHLAALKLLIVRNGGDTLTATQGSEHMYYRYSLPDVSLEEAQANATNEASPFYIPQWHYRQGGDVTSREAIKTLAGPPLLGACEMAYDKNVVTYGSDYRNGTGSGYIEIRLDKLSPQNRAIVEAMQGNPLYRIDFADSSEHILGNQDGNGTPFVRINFLTATTTGQLQQQSLDFVSKLEKQEYMPDVFDLNDPDQNEQFAEIIYAQYLLDSPEEIDKLFKDLVASKTIVVTEDNKVYIHPREYERVTGKKLSEYNPNPDFHYFPNKQSKLQFSENDARSNANIMDDVSGDPKNEELRVKAKAQIEKTLKEKGVNLLEGFVVDDALLDAAIAAHMITGGEGETLGNFSLGTLFNKRKALDTYLRTRTDLTKVQQSAIARCLMEGGFCGRKDPILHDNDNPSPSMERQHIADKKDLEIFLDRAFEGYKLTPEYQLFTQLGINGLVDQMLLLRRNELLKNYGGSQEYIAEFKSMSDDYVQSRLFDIGFESFNERVVDLESRLQLSHADIATIIKDYFSQEKLETGNDVHNLSMLGDLFVKIQNVAILKAEGVINSENEQTVQALANSAMFDTYFTDMYDLRDLISQNTVEQLQAKLDEKLSYNQEVLAMCQDLGFDVAEYSVTTWKLPLTYLRNLQKLKPIVYGNTYYIGLNASSQSIINNLSDFDIQFAIKYNLDPVGLNVYIHRIKAKTTSLKPEHLPGLETLFQEYKTLKNLPESYTLEKRMGSADFDAYVSLIERLGWMSNTDGLNRWLEFKALETNVLGKTVGDFMPLYESFGNDKLKYDQYYQLVERIAQSPSGELQLIGNELAQQLVGRENPIVILNQIIEIFEKNNLPEIGKQFKVFQILHPPKYLEQKIKGGEVFSPQLLELYNRTDISAPEKYQLAMSMFYTDLLQIHIQSHNPQLMSYIDFIVQGEGLLSKYESGQTLSPQETKQFVNRLQRLNMLYVNSNVARTRLTAVDNQNIDEQNLQDAVMQLKKQLGIGSKELVSSRLADIFIRPVGYSSFAELSVDMRSQQEQYHKRGEDLYNNARVDEAGNRVLALQEGNLIQGFGGEGVPVYMERVLQIGSVAKEFLGYGGSKSGDRTKLDADFIRVTAQSQDNFNQFTRFGDVHGVFEVDPDVVFETKVQGDDHVGIRTGIDSGKLKFIRVQESVLNNPVQLSQLFAHIAQNGRYIPVCDPTGKIIFSPSDYNTYRNAFEGTKNGDANMTLSAAPLPQQLQDIATRLEQDMTVDQESIMLKNQQLSLGINAILAKYGIQTKQDIYDNDLSKALVLNTGSTGRGTNVPGDFDFDLAIGLTEAQIKEHGAKIQAELTAFLGGQAAPGDKPGQIRVTGSPQFGDVDILITRRNQFTEYYTHNAIEDRLMLIKQQYGEARYNQVRANIVLAKKLFKEAGVYKKTEGGMTGAGVENWILSHGGDIYTAALSFLEAAKLYPNLQEFALHYLVLDPGVDLRSAARDNFLLLGASNQQSFEKIKAVCQDIVSGNIQLNDGVGNPNTPTPPTNPDGGTDIAPTQTKDVAEAQPSLGSDYFNGDKKNTFGFATEQAVAHSDLMTKVEEDSANTGLRDKAKQEIVDTLKAKGIILPEGFVVDDAFLDAVIAAHEINGGEGEGLGEFSLQTILAKRRALDAYLSKTNLNAEQQSAVARCLMEGGFCGKDTFLPDAFSTQQMYLDLSGDPSLGQKIQTILDFTKSIDNLLFEYGINLPHGVYQQNGDTGTPLSVLVNGNIPADKNLFLLTNEKIYSQFLSALDPSLAEAILIRINGEKQRQKIIAQSSGYVSNIVIDDGRLSNLSIQKQAYLLQQIEDDYALYHTTNVTDIEICKKYALTFDEYSAITHYKGIGYKINRDLFAGRPLSNADQQYRKDLETGLRKMPVTTDDLYRGQAIDTQTADAIYDKYKLACDQGSAITEAAFLSCSKNKSAHQDHSEDLSGGSRIFRTFEGVQGADISGISLNGFENEAIVLPNTLLYVQSIAKSGSDIFIKIVNKPLVASDVLAAP